MARIEAVSDGSQFTHQFYCPGCECYHGIVKGRWTFDDNYDFPTISPSIKVQWVKTSHGGTKKVKDMLCHTFVKAGKIQYLGDCTHHLVGQTIDLPDVDTME